MSVPDTYKLIAYVGRGRDDARPHWVASEGFTSFRNIFINRLPWARFAVLETIDNKFLVVDLFETTMDAAEFTVIMPDHLTFTDQDAAVMTAQLKL